MKLLVRHLSGLASSSAWLLVWNSIQERGTRHVLQSDDCWGIRQLWAQDRAADAEALAGLRGSPVGRLGGRHEGPWRWPYRPVGAACAAGLAGPL